MPAEEHSLTDQHDNPEKDRPSLQEPHGESDALGAGFAQILHDRARASSQELHTLLLSFSTGLLAVYFVALNTTKDPAQSRDGKP